MVGLPVNMEMTVMMTEAQRSAEEAIGQAAAGTNPEWRELALEAGRELAASFEFVTAQDILDFVTEAFPEVQTPEHRAMGPIMRQLGAEGTLLPTDRYPPSGRVRNHNRPHRLWASRTYISNAA